MANGFLDFPMFRKPDAKVLFHEMPADDDLDKLLKRIEEIGATEVGRQVGVKAYHVTVGCVCVGGVVRFWGDRLGGELKEPLPRQKKTVEEASACDRG